MSALSFLPLLSLPSRRGACEDPPIAFRPPDVRPPARSFGRRRRTAPAKSSGDFRYHDVPDPRIPPRTPPLTSAYQESTVVHRAPWFRSRRKCRETCCSERVAISLGQDDGRIKSTIDGMDLADVLVRGRYGQPDHLSDDAFHASDLADDLVPCLRDGTIVHVDNYQAPLGEFFDHFRPNITKRYVLITSESDLPSPRGTLRRKLHEDRNLIRWYGTNPNLGQNPRKDHAEKFVGFPLGLSKYVAQMPHLTHYLTARNFTNPFSDKRPWTESEVLFNSSVSETTDVLFVKFGINPGSQHRRVPFETVCTSRARRARDPVSCTLGKFSMHETYSAASRYLFGLSPRGVGADCYRTYEMWMLGVIPVVIDEPGFGEMFSDLPVVRLRTWNHTQGELLGILRDYVRSEEFVNSDFDRGWERLFLRYWRRRILRDAGREGDILEDEWGQEYYLAWRYSSFRKPV